MKRKIFAFMAACVAAGALLYETAVCAKPYNDLRENVFRLHIIAASDAESDQALKLAVRDDLLPVCKALLDDADLDAYEGTCFAEENANAVKESIGLLQQTAQESVYAHGSTVSAAVMVGYEAFPEKTYGEITMPAGDYYCLRVVLGAGKGRNWWCVLYPPLCLNPASAKESFSDEEWEILSKPKKYRFRLAILDWINNRKRKDRNNR